jgi:hypothetical protein
MTGHAHFGVRNRERPQYGPHPGKRKRHLLKCRKQQAGFR